MSTRTRKPAFTPTAPNVSDSKLRMIRSGKKKKTVTGFKENKNITFSNDAGKFIAVQKEKKFEETGVTRKKRNFIMFESKLGTERDTDITKIGGPDRRVVNPRNEERIIQKRKKKEYLDNFQYHETKNFKKNPSKPSIVIHHRLGNIYGGTAEEIQYLKTTSNVRPTSPSLEKNKSGSKIKSILKQNKSSSNLRNRPTTTTTTSTKTTSTKVGRRSGPNPSTSTTTTKTKTTTTIKGGQTKTRTTTSTTKGRK